MVALGTPQSLTIHLSVLGIAAEVYLGAENGVCSASSTIAHELNAFGTVPEVYTVQIEGLSHWDEHVVAAPILIVIELYAVAGGRRT